MSDVRLSDLPFECLVHCVSFVDTHTVVYSLAIVSQLFLAVANDPVLWAKSVVTPCCFEELLWLARKFPTMRFISSEAPTADIAEAVIECCPGVVYWPGVCKAVPEHTLSLVHAAPAHWKSMIPSECYISLRSVVFFEKSHELLVELAELCPNLTELETHSFLDSHPCAFPMLTRLILQEFTATTPLWVEFVRSHPLLRTFTIVYCHGEVAASSDMLTTLTTFKFNTRDEVPRSLGCSIIASCPGLRSLRWGQGIRDDTLHALMACPRLTELTASFLAQDNLNDELLAQWTELVSLKKLIDTSNTTPPSDVCKVLINALGDALAAPIWIYEHEEILQSVVPRMKRLVTLTITVYVSVESLELLVESVSCLRDLSVRPQGDYFTAAHYDALSGMAGGLSVLVITRGNSSMETLVRVAGSSPRMHQLRLYSAKQDETLISAFLSEYSGRPLHYLGLSGLTDVACAVVLESVKRGRLSAMKFTLASASARTGGTTPELEEARNLLRPCGRRQWGEPC